LINKQKTTLYAAIPCTIYQPSSNKPVNDTRRQLVT